MLNIYIERLTGKISYDKLFMQSLSLRASNEIAKSNKCTKQYSFQGREYSLFILS